MEMKPELFELGEHFLEVILYSFVGKLFIANKIISHLYLKCVCVCVCVCVRACVYACVRVCVWLVCLPCVTVLDELYQYHFQRSSSS